MFTHSTQLFAQTTLANQQNCDCPEFDKARGYRRFTDISKSTNEIEIRFANLSHSTNNTYTVISYNQGKYNAVHYLSKYPTYAAHEAKQGESPYHKYLIKKVRLDSVLNELLHSKVSSWHDPNLKKEIVSDPSVVIIQYKVNKHTGSYTVQLPTTVAQSETEAYKDLVKIIDVFKSITDGIHYYLDK